MFIAINAYHIGKILMHRLGLSKCPTAFLGLLSNPWQPNVQGRDLKLDEVEQMLWDAGFSEFLTKADLFKFILEAFLS